MGTTDTILVSYDFTHGKDASVLIVGRKGIGQTAEIIRVTSDKLVDKLSRTKAVKEAAARIAENV